MYGTRVLGISEHNVDSMQNGQIHMRSLNFVALYFLSRVPANNCALLSNYPTAQSRVKQRAIRVQISYDIVRLFGQLIILYFKKNLFINQSAVHAMLFYLLCFSRLMRNEQKDDWKCVKIIYLHCGE